MQRASAQAAGRSLRLRRRARRASRRSVESGRVERQGTAACCEGAARGRFGEPTVRPSFAVERRRAPGLPAIRPQRRARDGCGFASRGPRVLARHGCGQSVGSRGRRRVRRRRATNSTAVGRLVGERAFHFTASGSPSAFASRGLTGEASFTLAGASGQDLATQVNRSGESAVAAGFATAEAAPGAGAAPSSGAAAASAPIVPRARASQPHRASPTRATAAHEAVHGERGPEATAASAPARVASSAAPAPADSRGDGTDGRLPDPTGSNVPSLAQTDPFGALFSAPFAAASSFGLDPGHVPVGAVPARRSGARAAGAAGDAVPGREGAGAVLAGVSGQSWPRSRPRSATRRNAPRRWRWWYSASARGCGPASWWRCAAMTSSGTAARSWFCQRAGRAGWCRSPRITPAARGSWPAARAASSCSAPARPTAAIRTSSATSPGAWPLTRPRRGCRCAGPGPPSSAATWPRAPRSRCCWPSPGSPRPGRWPAMPATSAGISSSKGALRARWRAERTR